MVPTIFVLTEQESAGAGAFVARHKHAGYDQLENIVYIFSNPAGQQILSIKCICCGYVQVVSNS